MHSAPVCGLSFPKVFHPIDAAERKEPALSDFVDDLSNCPSRDALCPLVEEMAAGKEMSVMGTDGHVEIGKMKIRRGAYR